MSKAIFYSSGKPGHVPLNSTLVWLAFLLVFGFPLLAQDLEILVPDLTFGAHRFTDADHTGCLQVPIYVRNGTGSDIESPSFRLEFDVSGDTSLFVGGEDSIQAKLSNASLNSPFQSVSPETTCLAGTNANVEGALDASFPIDTVFNGGFEVVDWNPTENRLFVSLVRPQADTILIPQDSVRLLGILEISLQLNDATQTGSFRFEGTNDPFDNVIFNHEGTELPVTYPSGSEPNGVADFTLCSAAELNATVNDMSIDSEVCEGEALQLAVDLAGDGTATAFQWYKDEELLGITTPSLDIASLAITDAGSYVCEITTSCGTYRTAAKEISIVPLPSISMQPQSNLLCPLTEALSLSVPEITNIPVTYQWYFEGAAIPGATDAVFSRTPQQGYEAGSYTVRVTGECATVESEPAIIQHNEISSVIDPVPLWTVCAGSPMSLSVSAESLTPLSYQWQKDGVDLVDRDNLSGASTSALLLENLTLADIGDYRCVITNGCQTVNTTSTTLHVDIPPVIESSVVPAEICRDEEITLQLTVDAFTQQNGTYEWQKFNPTAQEFQPIPDATTAEIQLQFDSDDDFTQYRCVVTNECGTSNSDVFTFTEIEPLTITQDVQDVDLCLGATANFSFHVEGGEPTSVLWYFNDQVILGATTTELTLTDITADDVGTYYCQVFNRCNLIESHRAELRLDPFAVNVTPGSVAMGLNPIVLNANVSCGSELLDYEWRDEFDAVLSLTASLTVEPDLPQTSVFAVTVTNDAQETRFQAVTILVSENPNLSDPNGDGFNAYSDLVTVASTWLSNDLTFDANGDGKINVLDLEFVNRGN